MTLKTVYSVIDFWNTTVLWWQLGRDREMLLLCFGWEAETYCKSKHFSRELPVRLHLKIWSHRECDCQDRPVCALYPSLYKALTKKQTNRTNETCRMKPLTMNRFSMCWTSSIVFFLTEKMRGTITESQQSRTQCAAPATAEGPTALCQEVRLWGEAVHVPTPTALIQHTLPNHMAGLWKNPRYVSRTDEHEFICLIFSSLQVHDWLLEFLSNQPAREQKF